MYIMFLVGLLGEGWFIDGGRERGEKEREGESCCFYLCLPPIQPVLTLPAPYPAYC